MEILILGFEERISFGAIWSFEAITVWSGVVKIEPGHCYYWILKGYLRYKMITSQNVPSKAQIENFFIS